MSATEPVDLFLSYSHSDVLAVNAVRASLERRGLRTFLDQRDLVAGMPWPLALERELRACRAVAVFLGPDGPGLWQKREMYYALDLQVACEREGRRLPVIPVLLPGAEPVAGFLFLNTWIDLRRSLDDSNALDALVRAVAPEEEEREEEKTEANGLCPYRGLRAFREMDEALYFGREDFAQELVAKTLAAARGSGGPSLVTLIGPSGSGKSSLVLAGLIPRLRRSRPPDQVWDIAWQVPGERPFRRLADALISLLEPESSEAERIGEAGTLATALATDPGALASTVHRILAKSGGTNRLLLVVDQFEELFRLAPAPERGPFLRALLNASTVSPLTLVLVLRSDFYGLALEADRDLSDALGRWQTNLGPMREEELRRAIEGPALKVGLTLEPGVADLILEDVAAEPGRLPLLEYALVELWKRRQGKRMTLDGYLKTGRVAEAVATRAESLFSDLSGAQKQIARGLFTRLVHVAGEEDEGSDTRRRGRRSNLGEEAWSVAQVFAGEEARLLVIARELEETGETVELAHEALLRNWHRLRDWIAKDRAFLVWRQQLAASIKLWEDAGRDDEGLLRGPMLTAGQRWLVEKGSLLNKAESEFLRLSRREVQSRRWRTRAAAFLALVVLAVWGGWLAVSRTDAYQIRSILRENKGSQALADSEHASKYLASLVFLGHSEDALALALRGSSPNTQVQNLAVVAAALVKLQKGDQARKALERAEQIVARVGEPEKAYDLRALWIRTAAAAGLPQPMPPYAYESLSRLRPVERVDLLTALFGTMSAAGNAAQARDLLQAVESSAMDLRIPEDCGSLWRSALKLAKAGESGRGWALVQKTGCGVDQQYLYGGAKAESLALLGQREKALAYLAAAETESWEGPHELRALSALGRAYLALKDYRQAEELGKQFDTGVWAEALVAEGKIMEALSAGGLRSQSTAENIVRSLLRTHPRSEVERLIREHELSAGHGF
ncbi:MAG TPA: toll/interleukin-1 receptor domain-containing protein [Thermoanaerobaculia bacterium]|nr:toll/interleukin-1 receptor domain-containing protein [Thermoanaerobaculia bacterium]